MPVNNFKLLGAKNRVCIIEDDEMIREIYQKALEESGFVVMTAGDGEAGYQLIEREKPDVALVDLIMPKKDGISMIKDLQENKELSKIPIIVITNRSDDRAIEAVGKLNTKFYLEKAQFEPKEIVEHVREVLGVTP
jgi:two-component system, OmpR family, alkaline phosphatase synthesis response regulator PhoP